MVLSVYDTHLKMRSYIELFLVCFLTTYVSSWPHSLHTRQTESQEKNGNCIYTLCNETRQYPTEKLEKIIRTNMNFSAMFGGNVIEPLVNIGNRFGVEEQENVCKTRTITMFPQQGQNIEKKWRTIVNLDQYTQAVTFETCLTESSCIDEDTLAFGYHTFCKQQYIIVRMVVLNEKEELMLEKIPVPSGCNCVYSMK